MVRVEEIKHCMEIEKDGVRIKVSGTKGWVEENIQVLLNKFKIEPKKE